MFFFLAVALILFGKKQNINELSVVSIAGLVLNVLD